MILLGPIQISKYSHGPYKNIRGGSDTDPKDPLEFSQISKPDIYIHKHTHIYIYIYIYISGLEISENSSGSRGSVSDPPLIF